MSTTIIINDYVNNRRAHLVFVTNDFKIMSQFWETEDRVLGELQDHPAFVGKTRWCDLDPKHYRLLLMQNYVAADALTEDELIDDDHPVVRSLNFLFMAMCHCIALRSEGEIEIMRVNRLNKLDITYEVSLALMRLDVAVETTNDQNEDQPSSEEKRSAFKVIVDNTIKPPRD